MPARKVRDVVNRLTKKFGFQLDTKRSNDHVWYTRDVEGVGRMATKFSHGETEVSDNLLMFQARQLWVAKNYFEGMLDCSNTKDAWEKKIKEAPEGPLAQLALASRKKRK